MTDITVVVESAIKLFFTILVIFIIPKLHALINTKLNEGEMDYLLNSIAIAVRAAEQIYKEVPKSGVTKKQYVLDYLEKLGYSVNTQEISALIEAMVNELFPVSEVK